MFAKIDNLSKHSPQAAAVPLPVVLLNPARLAERKVLDLAMDRSQDLQEFLATVTHCLLNSAGKISYAPDIGRQLPDAMQVWLRKHDLRMCSVLAHYPNDFKIHKNGRARRVQCLRHNVDGVYSFEPSSAHTIQL
eukprot:TRINITY_DN3202_c0_g1_i11.p2 TRINITY_DN3202_c0_g1~~TRINITY_DN3202_c0_g1_i11.p2  ORF type:complete len:135 (+),score=25.15 TRINITY_DN3202_c0_g1_i11:140-544(+)